MPRPRPRQLLLLLLSLIRQRFTCHSASLQSIASSIGSHGTWLRGMPQRVQFIKLNTAVALCSAPVCAVAVAAVAMQPDVVHIFCFFFCRFCCFCRCLRCALCYQQSYVCPSLSRIPFAAMPYAVSRFLIYAIPCMCHISAAKHAAHACGAWLQQKYHKKCHKCST